MKQWFMEKLYRPMLFFFLLPLFYIILGSLFALPYNALNFISFIGLYLFILVNQMLENILLRIPTSDFEVSKPFILGLEFLNLALLLYFGFQHSWLAAMVLLFYTFIIQMQFVFSYYDLDYIAAFIAAFLKVFLLNGFAFYIHTNFIHPRYLPFYIGLFIPFFLFEVTRTNWKPKGKWLPAIIFLSLILGILLLWSLIEWKSLLLLLVLPFVVLFRVEFSRKTTAIFAFIFSLTYLLLILLF